MKAIACFIIFAAILVPVSPTQEQPSTAERAAAQTFTGQLRHDNIHLSISSGVAQGLLLRKVEPVWKHAGVEELRVTGTVVIMFEIGKKGDVLHPMVLSGPALLQGPVLEAVRKYKYKPYLLNGKATAVATSINVTTQNY